MQKRGQVTIFIIMSIFIIIIVSLLFLLKENIHAAQLKQDEADNLELSLNVEKVKSTIEYCIDKTAERSIFTLGYHGGKKSLVQPFFEEEIFNANYLYYLGEKNASSIKEMELILEEMMNEHLPRCVNKFNKIKQENVNEEIINQDLLFNSFQLEVGEVNTSVSINKKVVNFNVDWPLKISFKNKVKEINKFPNHRFSVDLYRMGLFLEEFMERMKNNSQIIDVFYLLEQNYSINSLLFNNDTYVFLVADNNSMLDYGPLTFLFSTKINSTGVLI